MTDDSKVRSRPWTDEEHAELLSLWRDRTLTQAQRAARLGRPLGSVVGRLRRHGLVDDRPLKMKFTAKTETVVAKPVDIPRFLPTAAAEQVDAPSASPAVGNAIRDFTLAAIRQEHRDKKGVASAVANLGIDDCRWPLGGHPGLDPDFRFCCARKLEDSPYCREHAAMAYSAPRR